MLRSHKVSKAAVRQPSARSQTRQYGGLLSVSQSRHHAHPRAIQLQTSFPHVKTLPNSHRPTFKNEFSLKPYSQHVKDLETAPRFPEIKDPKKLWQSSIGDPHFGKGWVTMEYCYRPYCATWEPSFPPMPEVRKGELLAGAQFYRTQGWKEAMSSPTEPAITTVGRLDPDNQRAVDAATMPVPESVVSPGEYDFRHCRLPVWHADRRPFIYFVCAGMTACGMGFLRGTIKSIIYQNWPGKDVFASDSVEVDLRPVELGQNFSVKWRGKPVFFRHRTQEMIDLAKADDAIVGSFRDPEMDHKRCPRPQWLVCMGVCTHLGCIPYPDQGNYGGYFCPCHGSHYDHSGRIREGPAPSNLEVPPHQFLDDLTVKVG